MRVRSLGCTGIGVSEVGFGCWQLGQARWGPISSQEVLRAVHRALDLGISVFDTAPIYGFGRSEEMLGRALREIRAPCVVVSKGGLVWDSRHRVRHDNRRETLVRGLAESLRRLRRDLVDVYLLHWPDPVVPLEETLGVLEDLRESGRIRAWGVSNFPARELLAAASSGLGGIASGHGPVLAYPLNATRCYAGEYRASGEAGRALLPVAARERWGFMAFDVLMRGLLGGRYDETTRFGKRDLRRRDWRFHGQAFVRNLNLTRQISQVTSARGIPAAAIAIRATLENPAVSTCLVGMKTVRQVEECALASGLELPPGSTPAPT